MRKRVNLLLSLILYITLIATIVFVIFNYIKYSWIILLIIITLTILTGIIIFVTNRMQDAKISWIMVTLCLPIIGIFLYWTFGRPYHYRRKQKIYLKTNSYFYTQEDWTFANKILEKKLSLNEDTLSLFNYTTRISHRPFYNNTDVQILTNGPIKFVKLIEDLKQAKNYIFINYFILSEGELLEVILDVLKSRITAGVKVYIIYDAVGSYFSLSKYKIWKMKKMGIIIHKFSPVRLPFMTGNYNFRNHRKDIIIDGNIGYAGGVNLADNYIFLSAKYGFWRDTQIRFVGEAVKSLDLIFRQDWHFITGNILDVVAENTQEKVNNNNIIVQVIDDGPLTKETIQKDLFIKFISNAKKRVWISTPYLIPTTDLITALRNSAYSGVDVRLSLPGITDKFFSLDMSRTYYDSLIEAGVKIYEYNNVFNHSKSGIFDDNITIIGSTNLDYRSLYSDHQTLVIVYDKQTNSDLATSFENDFVHSSLIIVNPLLKRSFAYRSIFLLLLRILAPLF